MIHKDADLSQAGESGFGMVGSERMSWFAATKLYTTVLLFIIMIDNNRVIEERGVWGSGVCGDTIYYYYYII